MARGDAIASGSVILTTNADGLKTGLDRAAKDVDGWGKKVGDSTGGKGGGGLGGMFGKGAAFGAGAMAVQGIVGTVGDIAAKFGELTEAMDATSKQARTLGTSTEFLSGLQHAADLSGISTEELGGALSRFRKEVDGPLDEALLGFAKNLEGIEDPGERARLLVEKFGKSGLKLAPMFEEGAGGLEAMVAEAKELGIAFSEADGKQIEAANDAISKTKAALRGLFQTAMIQLAPFVEMFANLATEAIKFLRPVADWLRGTLVDAFRAVGTVGAHAFDVIKFGVGAVAEALGFMVSKALAPVIRAFTELVGLSKSLPDSLRPGWVDKMNASLEGADASVRGIGEQMQAWGKGARESFGKSAEDFNKWLDKILAPKEAGKEIGARMAEGMMEELEPLKFAGAMLAGSKESYSAIVKNQFRNQGVERDPAKQMVNEQKKGNRINERNGRELGKVREALEDLESI